jgi:hypothetical protein
MKNYLIVSDTNNVESNTLLDINTCIIIVILIVCVLYLFKDTKIIKDLLNNTYLSVILIIILGGCYFFL